MTNMGKPKVCVALFCAILVAIWGLVWLSKAKTEDKNVKFVMPTARWKANLRIAPGPTSPRSGVTTDEDSRREKENPSGNVGN